MGATAQRGLRIGELAELTGTTPRTIRYYEEIGLLPGAGDRPQGHHRVYAAEDVQRLREVVRLRDLLGLSLEALCRLVAAEDARAELRREYERTGSDAERGRILDAALPHIDSQLELVRERRGELERLEDELTAKRRRVRAHLRELSS